jgi:hypothetical protein
MCAKYRSVKIKKNVEANVLVLWTVQLNNVIPLAERSLDGVDLV